MQYYLKTIVTVIFLLTSVIDRRMADPNVLQQYPEPSKPTPVGAWPTPGQIQYAQQPYMQPGVGGPAYVFHQGLTDPSIAQIRDWLPWSITNMFFGWILGGILPLIFSLVCRNYKNSNNASGARTMSTLALVFNILVTLAGIAAWIVLIVSIVLVKKAVNTVTTCVWPYC